METKQKEKPKYQAIGVAGNSSYTLVLPKQFATSIGLERGDFVRVTQDDKRLIIEKAE